MATNKTEDVKRCIWCNKILTHKNTYTSKSRTHFTLKDKNGEDTDRMIWCKVCVNNQYAEYFHKCGDVKKALWYTCRLFDIPYIPERFDMAKKQLKEEDYASSKMLGTYMKYLYSLDWKKYEWACFDDGTTGLPTETGSMEDITPEQEDKWGKGYQPEEYEAFESKYQKIKNNYPERTSLHTEALLNYIRYRCKEELATAAGKVKEAKEWGAMAKDAATAAKINPSQLSAADLQGGLNSFSELAKVAEENSDIIKKLPYFTYRPNDSADFILWCIVNYMRKAKGSPEVTYHDIYSFYDKKREEYIEQYGDPYGIFESDPTIKNRDNIQKFIDTSYGDDKNE